MNRLALFNYFLLLPAAVSAQISTSDTSMKTVISSEEIRSAGISRLHELFTLFDNWTGYTINGQDWYAAAYGLSVYEEPGWIVMIDNHPVAISVIGLKSFNMLPVSLQEIEKIVIIDTPQLYRGIYADRGLIRIITDRSQAGWRTDLRFSIGNEINDPGPFEFTELNSPNEERLGPDADIVLGYRSANWHLQGSGSVMRHRSTDTPVERRIFDMLQTASGFEDPTNLKIAGHITGGFNHGGLELNIQGGALTYRDFLFFHPYGREIPIQLQNRYAGVDASYEFTNDLSLTFSSTLNRREPGYSPNREDFRFDFYQTDLSHNLELQWGNPDRQLSSGIRFEYSNAGGNFDLSPQPLEIWTFYQQWNEQLFDKAGIRTSLRLAGDGNDFAVSTGLMGEWEIINQQYLKPYFSYSERLPSQTQDLWFWIGNGYTGLDPLSIEHEPLPQRKTSVLTSAGVSGEFSPAENIGITLHPHLHHHRGYFLSRQQFSLIRPHQWFTHEGIGFFPDEKLTLAGFNASVSLQSYETVSHTVFFGIRSILWGSEELKNKFGEIPARRFRFSTLYAPLPGFELWASLQAQSAVNWREFDSVDGQIYTDLRQLDEGTYSAQSGPILHMDAGGRKALWSDRIWISLFVKNLLNRPYFHYPVGADKDLTFFVQIELSL